MRYTFLVLTLLILDVIAQTSIKFTADNGVTITVTTGLHGPPPAEKREPLWFVPSGPATKENCNAEGKAVLAGKKEVYQTPSSDIFVPQERGTDICIFFAPPNPQEWQVGKGLRYNSKSCSEGCCYFPPASSRRVQEIEARYEEHLPTWFRAPAGGCNTVPRRTFTSRLILNKDNNVRAVPFFHNSIWMTFHYYIVQSPKTH